MAGQSYTIQPGDTLSGIASKYGMNWQQLQSANQGTIQNPNLIYAGTSIQIPGVSATSFSMSDKIPTPGVYTTNWTQTPFTSSNITGLEDAALTELEPYYAELLAEAGGDVKRAKQRLQEDYTRGMRIKTEDVANAIKYATEDTGFAKEGVSDKLKIANETLSYLDQTKFPLARQAMLNTFNSRGLYNSGLRVKGMEDLGAQQTLERLTQTTDIAGLNRENKQLDVGLARTEEQQNLGAARYKEAADINVTRSTEDIDLAYEKKKKELEQAKRLEAIQMAQLDLARQVAGAQVSRQYGNG